MKHDLSKFENNPQDVNEPLSEPHFDDEATLLSARRVVPFHKLIDETSSKKHLFFGATLAVALVMGAVGGVIYGRLEGTPASKAETTEQAAQPALQDEFVSSSAQSETASSPEESKATAEEKDYQKTAEKRPNSSINAKINRTPVTQAQTDPDEFDYYDREREMRRAERREARRARRQAEREAQQSDDLFRIREIFEGSSRP